MSFEGVVCLGDTHTHTETVSFMDNCASGIIAPWSHSIVTGVHGS